MHIVQNVGRLESTRNLRRTAPSLSVVHARRHIKRALPVWMCTQGRGDASLLFQVAMCVHDQPRHRRTLLAPGAAVPTHHDVLLTLHCEKIA